MDHKAFMTAFMKMTKLFLTRDENDENAARVLKFIGIFVASFGEETDENSATHPIIRETFHKILDVSFAYFVSHSINFALF